MLKHPNFILLNIGGGMSKKDKLQLEILLILATHHLSINQFSKIIGISKPTIIRILSGQFDLISAKMWKKVKCSIVYFDSMSANKR